MHILPSSIRLTSFPTGQMTQDCTINIVKEHANKAIQNLSQRFKILDRCKQTGFFQAVAFLLFNFLSYFQFIKNKLILKNDRFFFISGIFWHFDCMESDI